MATVKLPVIIPTDQIASLNNLRAFFKDLQSNGYSFGQQIDTNSSLQFSINTLKKQMAAMESPSSNDSSDFNATTYQIMAG